MHTNLLGRSIQRTSALWLTLFCIPGSILAADQYWDSNGAAAGAGAAPAGIWGTSGFWTGDPLGATATGVWASGNLAIFSAGTDAIENYTVTLNGTQTASGLVFEEGAVILGGTGSVNIGGGSVTVRGGASLSTDSSQRIAATAGAVYTLDGGNLITTRAIADGSFIDPDASIALTAAGGTLSYDVPNVLNIIEPTTGISGAGSLIKAGAGILALAGKGTWAGATTVQGGEFRMRGANDRLPVSTPVTVTSPGILNLNGLNQKIGSLTGDGLVGTANGTLTIEGSTNSTFSGIIKDTANAGIGGSAASGGKLRKSGTGVITLTGLNTITGGVTLTGGGITVEPNATLCAPSAALAVDGGTLTFNNANQTVSTFTGTGGNIVLGAGHTLTVDPAFPSSYSGTISGPGGLTKQNTRAGTEIRTLTLSGNNTYTGATTILGGIVAETASGFLSDTSPLIVDGASSVFDLGHDHSDTVGTVALRNGDIDAREHGHV
jgi:fibronectin-binding autotransporter adhesin